jgi:hypothetical protein
MAYDIALGFERTFEMVGGRGLDRAVEVSRENGMLIKLLFELAKFPLTGEMSPMFRVLEQTLAFICKNLPDEQLNELAADPDLAKALGFIGRELQSPKVGAMAANQSTEKSAYYGGRLLIGQKIAVVLTRQIAAKVAAMAVARTFMAKLAANIAAGGSGVGVPVALLGLQGIMQRSSNASKRLQRQMPPLWGQLRARAGLDLMYFLIEEAVFNFECKLGLRKQEPFFVYELRNS